MQLIQYEPATKQVYKVPLLLIPAWINKYYIFDLTGERSFIHWLTEKEWPRRSLNEVYQTDSYRSLIT